MNSLELFNPTPSPLPSQLGRGSANNEGWNALFANERLHAISSKFIVESLFPDDSGMGRKNFSACQLMTWRGVGVG